MDSGGIRFAIGLLIFWGAFLLLFIALHPNGISGANNPTDALKWLIKEFQTVSGINAAATTNNAATGPNNAGSAPTASGA